MSDTPNMEQPPAVDLSQLEIPQLDIASYGDQETFLAMLELIVNTLVTVVNALVVAELARNPVERKRILALDDVR